MVFSFSEAIEDRVLLELDEAGTLGLTVEESTPAGSGDRVGIAYFERGTHLGTLLRRLESLGASIAGTPSTLEDPGWVERQAADRRPIAVGNRFLIVPELPGEPPAAGGRIMIIVPPRRAFGTGEHETTRLCLEILESIDLRGRSVLDLGTGSGILAMAARRLGAERVLGIDNDPEAIGIAKENLVANGIAETRGGVEIGAGDLGTVGESFDVVVANIEAGLLENEARRLASIQREGARMILSGFSPDDATTVRDAFLLAGFEEVERRVSGGWSALHLARREEPPA